MISIKVPARICLYGDHQDYLGLPVIAGAIDRFITLTAAPNQNQEFRIDLKNLNQTRTIPLSLNSSDIDNGDYFRSGMAVLKKRGHSFENGFDIKISGNIPLNAGLSSSSALVVAWIRFLLSIQDGKREVTDAEIGQMAYEAEVLFFDQPGGLMDQYTIAQQGLLFIDTTTSETERLTHNFDCLIVAESGIEKQTLQVLQNAKVYQIKALECVKQVFPEYKIQEAALADFQRYLRYVPEYLQDYWYAVIYNYEITKKARLILNTDKNQKKLAELMNEHQEILQNHIQNTPPKMVYMMAEAKNAGALGAKTIGSGGGGCMLAMGTKDKQAQIIEAFLKAGAKNAYEVKLVG